MFPDTNSFSQNGHQRPNNSGGAIHIGINGHIIPDSDRKPRKDISGLQYTKNPTPKVEAKIFIAILFSVGGVSGLLAFLLNIAAWEAHLLFGVAIISSVSALIWRWVDKYQAWKMKNLEIRLKEKELNELHF